MKNPSWHSPHRESAADEHLEYERRSAEVRLVEGCSDSARSKRLRDASPLNFPGAPDPGRDRELGAADHVIHGVAFADRLRRSERRELLPEEEPAAARSRVSRRAFRAGFAVADGALDWCNRHRIRIAGEPEHLPAGHQRARAGFLEPIRAD